jgi:hypothetical protein
LRRDSSQRYSSLISTSRRHLRRTAAQGIYLV